MAKQLLIVHGYSDGYVSSKSCFRKLENFLVSNGAYARKAIHFVEYASMDDQSTYEDFADKLNTDYEKKIGAGNRVDILCHSTGALVARVWLARRRQRQRERGLPVDNPAHRMFMFAPANFGSDLARMGQSFLGKLRCTFFNKNAFKNDKGESGRVVLQGLEPASPFQWKLSMADLHTETYFGTDDESGKSCFPFVFAAGDSYKGVQAKLIKARNKPGTDGTVRICGTDMNSRKCTLRSSESGSEITWQKEQKHPSMPFSVFQGFNHGSIINPDEKGFLDPLGPGTALLRALKVNTATQYAKAATDFTKTSDKNYETVIGKPTADQYQQFFFKVRDDAGFKVDDFFIDFHVEAADREDKIVLNRMIDDVLESKVTAHSQDRSMRAFLVNLMDLDAFVAHAKSAKAQILITVNARRPSSEVNYEPTTFKVHDFEISAGNQPAFLWKNTTTLVEIVLNRRQSDKVLKIRATGG